MKMQTNKSIMLHRPSRRINRVAIAVASNRADMRNATVGPLPLDSPRFRTGHSKRSLLVSQSGLPTCAAGHSSPQLFSMTVPNTSVSARSHDISNLPNTQWSPRPTGNIKKTAPEVQISRGQTTPPWQATHSRVVECAYYARSYWIR